MGKFIVRCAGIVKKEDKFLLVKTNYGSGEYWIFPGGGVESGESMRDCVKREIKEETGIDVDIKKLVFVNENLSKENPMIHFTFLCEPKNDDLIVGSDPDQKEDRIKDVKYMTFDEILNLENFIPEEMKKPLKKAYENNFKQGETFF